MNFTINEYEEVRFSPGSTIDKAVEQLLKYHEQGRKVSGVFNGTKLYSDTVNIDKAYLSITGRTRSEHKKYLNNILKSAKKKEEEHKESIPQLTGKYIKLGRQILDKSKWREWEEIVPIRLRDLYQGMELKNCLDIIVVLNKAHNSIFDYKGEWKRRLLEEATEIFDKQGHSGMSASLVTVMVEQFAKGDEGKDFKKRVL